MQRDRERERETERESEGKRERDRASEYLARQKDNTNPIRNITRRQGRKA